MRSVDTMQDCRCLFALWLDATHGKIVFSLNSSCHRGEIGVVLTFASATLVEFTILQLDHIVLESAVTRSR